MNTNLFFAFGTSLNFDNLVTDINMGLSKFIFLIHTVIPDKIPIIVSINPIKCIVEGM